MKRLAILLLALISPALAQTGSGGSNYVIPTNTSTCTIEYKTGQITTKGCDFSSPMKNPKFTPGDRDKLTIEFEQTIYSTSGTMITGPGVILTPNGTIKPN